jgi:hypothetical protein
MDRINLRPGFRAFNRNIFQCSKCERIEIVDSRVEKYIHRENLALLKKCLTEDRDEPERQVIIKLLAEERAKDFAPQKERKMNRRGIEFTLVQVESSLWRWQFRIGENLTTGKTKTRLKGMAVRKAQQRIDRELRDFPRDLAATPTREFKLER